MENFRKHFVKEPDGSWLCVEYATLSVPAGRIQVTAGSRFQPGTDFMGVDLARMLEEAAKNSRPD